MKKTISGLMLSTLLLGGVVVNAAPTTGTEADPAKGTATIGFTENNNPTGPVDPTDPSKPNPDPETYPGENNKETGALGPLSLDIYPSNFDFGSHVVDMKGDTYNSTLTGIHYLQITDNRDDLDGWSVKVSRTEFTSGENQLTGSTLMLPAGTARNALNTDASAADANLKTGGAMAIPVETTEATNATTIFGAPNTAGVGKSTSTYIWEASEETLTVPKNVAKKGTYTSTINWVLVSEAAQ